MALSRRLAEIAETCRRHRLWLISDEIYHGLEYEAPAETALAHSDEAAGLSSILPADGAFYLYNGEPYYWTSVKTRNHIP